MEERRDEAPRPVTPGRIVHYLTSDGRVVPCIIEEVREEGGPLVKKLHPFGYVRTGLQDVEYSTDYKVGCWSWPDIAWPARQRDRAAAAAEAQAAAAVSEPEPSFVDTVPPSPATAGGAPPPPPAEGEAPPPPVARVP